MGKIVWYDPGSSRYEINPKERHVMQTQTLQLPLKEGVEAPKRAGGAILQFLRKPRGFEHDFSSLDTPHRLGKTIVIPGHVPGEFRPLAGGEKFLLKLNGRPNVWFGGMDEEPFLAELKDEAYQAFVEGGEEKFLEELKPPIIRSIERAGHMQAKRQGDILAVKLASNWVELRRKLDNCPPSTTTASPLFNTQHRLNGRYVYVSPLGPHFGSSYELPGMLLIAEGVVTAPDHAPMKLKEPHLVAQNRHLVHPHLH